ncbi:MAG TPA: hypothetical protein VIV40_11890 [Kofleriaceae bacterium]
MKRLALALAAALLVALAITTTVVDAELENQIFTSKTHRLRLVVPRGWRATDQPSYPGMLLWMLRSKPDGKMVVTAEPFTRKVYCDWPPECRSTSDPLAMKLACALRQKLTAQRIRVGPVQAGPKENEQAGMPSVWFELDDGKHYVRQAVALGEDRVVSLTLSTSSAEARSAHVRAFEQALRTLRPLTLEEMGSALPPPEQVVMQMVVDAGVADAGAPADAAPQATATFESAPAPKVNPVGPCTKQ